MATKTWKGFLSLGMVSIPVYLNTAARDEHVSLNTFHSTCGSPIKMPKSCELCGVKVPSNEIDKGYTNGDSYVPITAEELEAITPATGKVMEIADCVKAEEVDAVYLAESFYLLPEDPGRKAYSLLVQALTKSGCVALAQLTKNGREHIVMIRPRGNGLMLHYIYYPNEVNKVPEFDGLQQVKLTPAEMGLASKLVDSMLTTFQPEQFENGYDMRLNALIASKLDKTKPAPKAVTKTPVQETGDITAALMASLEAGRPKRRISLTDDDARPAPSKAAKKSRRAA